MIDGKLGLEADELGGGIRDDAWEVYPPGGRVTVVRCRCSAGCMGGFEMGSANSSGIRCAAMMGGGISGRVAYREIAPTFPWRNQINPAFDTKSHIQGSQSSSRKHSLVVSQTHRPNPPRRP